MHTFFTPFFFFTLLVSLVIAIPTPVYERRGRSFTVHRKRNQNYVPNGTRSLLKAYRKFGIPIPDEVVTTPFNTSEAVAGGQQNGQVDAVPESNDSEYLSEVVIGGQTMMMDFDSGSSDL
jgi:aspergillopepsin I